MMVLDFNDFVMRHGEGSVQVIVEQMEKANGIHHAQPLPLEDRWLIAMGFTHSMPAQHRHAA